MKNEEIGTPGVPLDRATLESAIEALLPKEPQRAPMCVCGHVDGWHAYPDHRVERAWCCVPGCTCAVFRVAYASPPVVDTKPPALGVVWTTSDAIADGPSTVEVIERENDHAAWRESVRSVGVTPRGLVEWLSEPTAREASDAEMTAFLRGAV